MNCNNCGNITHSKIKELFNEYVCATCYKLDKYKLISKTEIKKKYGLYENELNSIDYELKNNNHNRHTLMSLYRVDKIIEIVKNKYPFINIYTDDIQLQIENIKKNKKKETLNKLLETQNIKIESINEQLINDYINGIRGTRKEIFYECKKLKLLEKLKQHNFSHLLNDNYTTQYFNNEITFEQLLNILNTRNEKYLILSALPNFLNTIDFILENYFENSTYLTNDEIIKIMNENISKKNYLKLELSKFEVELRDDSEICNSYLYGNSKYSFKEVIEKTVEINWFYNYTNYSEILNELYEWEFEEMEYKGYFYTPDKYEMSACAKVKTIQNIINKNIILDEKTPIFIIEIFKSYEIKKLNTYIKSLNFLIIENLNHTYDIIKKNNKFNFLNIDFIKEYVNNYIFNNKNTIFINLLQKETNPNYNFLTHKYLNFKNTLNIENNYFDEAIKCYIEKINPALLKKQEHENNLKEEREKIQKKLLLRNKNILEKCYKCNDKIGAKCCGFCRECCFIEKCAIHNN